jgi:hypothetical protein
LGTQSSADGGGGRSPFRRDARSCHGNGARTGAGGCPCSDESIGVGDVRQIRRPHAALTDKNGSLASTTADPGGGSPHGDCIGKGRSSCRTCHGRFLHWR